LNGVGYNPEGNQKNITEFEKEFDKFLSNKGLNKTKINTLKTYEKRHLDENLVKAIIHIYQQGCIIENIAKITNRRELIIRRTLISEDIYVQIKPWKPRSIGEPCSIVRKIEIVRKLELLVESDENLSSFEKMSKVELNCLLDGVQKYIENILTDIDKQNLSMLKKDLVGKGIKCEERGLERRLELVSLIANILNIKSYDINSLGKASKEEMKYFGLKLIELKSP